MYIPPYFSLDEASALDLIEAHNFATLVSIHEGKPFATHVPLLLDRKSGVLRGHIAKSNPQWKDIESQEILVVFLADHHYISPAWYESLDNVPTWNYSAVHVYGNATVITERSELLALLQMLIRKHEMPESGYGLEAVSHRSLAGLMSGIVGFTIEITRIEGKSKMSQNHPELRRRNVIDALRQNGSDSARAVARNMEDIIEASSNIHSTDQHHQ